MNKTFHSLKDEARFTREILGVGVTQLSKANYAQKGNYFLAFTALSTGLERIAKLCVLLDFYIHNDCDFPDHNYLKNKIGHDLNKLYNISQDIAIRNNISFQFLSSIEDPIQLNILSILSGFAKGDRYSNIDFLVRSNHQSDPIKVWSTTVDDALFESKVSEKKKKEIEHNSQFAQALMGSFAHVVHHNEKGNNISDVQSASYRTGMTESILKYRQLCTLQIIRYWVELCNGLQRKAMGMGKDEIPFMSEIFAIFYNEDSYFKTRKTYDKDY